MLAHRAVVLVLVVQAAQLLVALVPLVLLVQRSVWQLQCLLPTTTTTSPCLFQLLSKLNSRKNASDKGAFFFAPTKTVRKKLFTVIRTIRNLLLAAVCMGLSACTSNFSAAYDMYQALKDPDPDRFANFEFNPNFQYLEVHSVGAQAMMVLGYVTAPQQQPSVQTWYDSEQQLLRLQNGFLISLTGVPNTISNTEYTWPAENQQGVQLPTAKTYSQPDQQVFEKTVPMVFEAISPSTVNTKNSLLRQRLLNSTNPQGESLTWFKEVPAANSPVPFSLYAFSANGKPVYGSQCLSPNACVEWLYRTNTPSKS